MKKIIPLLIAGFLFYACNSTDDESIKSEEIAKLKIDLEAIESMATNSACGPEYECIYIGLGSKACGGPQTYLVYSSSIDTQKLEAMVAVYNEKEKAFNEAWQIASDCAIVPAPDEILCNQGACEAIYNNSVN